MGFGSRVGGIHTMVTIVRQLMTDRCTALTGGGGERGGEGGEREQAQERRAERAEGQRDKERDRDRDMR